MINVLIDDHMLNKNEGGNERYIKNLRLAFKEINDLKCFSVRKETGINNDLFRLGVKLPYLASKHKADIIHSTYISPFNKKVKSVVTVHDFSFKKYPEFYNLKEKIIFNILLPFSMKQADAIIVPSNFSKKEAIKFYPQYKNKIFITPEAAQDTFSAVNKNFARKIIFNKYKISFPFLLALNSPNPKKNICKVIEAYNKIKLKFPQLKLVIIGGSYNIPKLLLKTDGVIIINNVSDHDLQMFYNACKIFIYYSLYEGFGLPLLEALKCKTAVIASDIEVHKEITKNSIIYAHPLRFNDLALKAKLLLSEKEMANKVINKGFKISCLYSWKETAKKTFEVYQYVKNL